MALPANIDEAEKICLGQMLQLTCLEEKVLLYSYQTRERAEIAKTAERADRAD
jgi:hypothetical protein